MTSTAFTTRHTDHRYRGPITTVIFDWAGTILDFGCIAPVAAFTAAFAEHGVEITEAEARRPMGAAKREHIQQILSDAEVARRWQDRQGSPATESNVDSLYAAFLRFDAVNCARYSTLIPGAFDTVSRLRQRGVAIGSTTGYPRGIMEALMPLAAVQGYKPDHCVTVSDVARGRPWPDMILANALALQAPDVRACVVVDDSPTGLASARAAGMWAVGIAASGNEVGLSQKAWEALDIVERQALTAPARDHLMQGGAHFVIDSVASLLPVIDTIETLLQAGVAP